MIIIVVMYSNEKCKYKDNLQLLDNGKCQIMFIHNQVFSSPEEPGYEVLLTFMSVLVNTVRCTASVCFSNTAGMVVWMW